MIADALEDESPIAGEIEVDESYFGGARKGKRGRGATGKVAVFGRGDKVYTKIIPDASGATLLRIIERKVAIVYSDSWKGYNVLDVSHFHHRRINHTTAFVDEDRRNHINSLPPT